MSKKAAKGKRDFPATMYVAEHDVFDDEGPFTYRALSDKAPREKE